MQHVYVHVDSYMLKYIKKLFTYCFSQPTGMEYAIVYAQGWPSELPAGSNIIGNDDVITALKYYQVFGDTLDWWMELTEVQY